MDVKIVVFKYENFISFDVGLLSEKKKKKKCFPNYIDNQSFWNFQEIDLVTETLTTIQSGSRKLLGKASPVHVIQIHDGLIYAATSSLDGTAVKVS